MPEVRRGAACALALIAIPASAEDDARALVRLRADMDAVISHNRVCANVVHCRVLPIGYDDCGNPTAFLAFNNLRGIRGELEGKIAEYNFIEEEQRRGKPRPTDCRLASVPQPACINNHCAFGAENY